MIGFGRRAEEVGWRIVLHVGLSTIQVVLSSYLSSSGGFVCRAVREILRDISTEFDAFFLRTQMYYKYGTRNWPGDMLGRANLDASSQSMASVRQWDHGGTSEITAAGAVLLIPPKM